MFQDTRLPWFVNRLKRRLFSHVWLIRIFILILLLSGFLALLLSTLPPGRFLLGLLTPPNSQLSHTSNRTNLLILGIGGPGHEAPDLTDTIILASIHLTSGETTLISIPRDIWVPSLRTKVNAAYHYGRLRQPDGGGLQLAKSAVSEIINQPVHYALVLDFSTFQEFINLLGGLDIQVERSFTDDRYPLPGREADECDGDPELLCRYETISFTSGLQYMNGATILKFVRSRNSSTEEEGTDYARSHRQAQVIKAIQTKLIAQARHPSNWSTLRSAFELISSGTITDFPRQNTALLLRLALMVRRHPFKTFALSEPDTLFHPPVSPTYDNQWVLVPRDNDPQVVINFVSDILNSSPPSLVPN